MAGSQKCDGLLTTLSGQNRFHEAADCFYQCVQLQPGFGPAHFQLGLALQRLGQLDDALRCFQRAVECQPNYVAGLRKVGEVLQQLGRTEEADVVVAKALALEPDGTKS